MKYYYLTLILLFFSCSPKVNEKEIEKYKLEILQTEKDFEEMALKEGIAAAFYEFAAEDAVINRNNTLIKGRDSIKAYYAKNTLEDLILKWDPDYIDVASSGELAYTYGKFNLTAIDTSGQKIDVSGVFHTVWKRQEDGIWRFVWD
jgi:ketosteroid isomerase-like protein